MSLTTQKAFDQLTKHKHLLQETIKECLKGFWVDVAIKSRLTYGPQRKVVDTWVKFQNAIRSVTNRKEAQKICEILYVSLNFVFNYREQMADAVLNFCKLRILDTKKENSSNHSNNGVRSRKKRSFVLKLISQMQTDVRKTCNTDAENHTGFTYTKQNPDGDDGRRLKDKHRYLKFYDWMIMGTYVR